MTVGVTGLTPHGSRPLRDRCVCEVADQISPRVHAGEIATACQKDRRGLRCGSNQRAVDNKAVVRAYHETRHAAGCWHCERRVVPRIEATERGLDIRHVVNSLRIGSAEWIYDSLDCARGRPRT